MKNVIKIFSLILLLKPFLNLNANLEQLKLKDGFSIEIYANNLKQARALSISDNGTLYVGSKSGFIYAIDKNKKVYTLASKLKLPIGLSYYKKDLYISDIDIIYVIRDVEKNINSPKLIKLIDNLPYYLHHGGRYIKAHNDKLYINLGAPCDTCLVKSYDEKNIHSVLLELDLKTKNKEIFAYGVRNSVGFDFHPISGDLYFSDNGRDNLGENIPPDEINVAVKKGLHFGYPFIHGKNIKDPVFFKSKNVKETVAPIYELPAHIAPLGIHFYIGNMFPSEYKNKLFIAEHGSWNKTEPEGYRISTLEINPQTREAKNYDIFIEGWLNRDGSKWGRPVDIVTAKDGALFISDDYYNVVYRVKYNKN